LAFVAGNEMETNASSAQTVLGGAVFFFSNSGTCFITVEA
jgi:GTP1/Obg family GTP-binding protein